jgi:tetratricopeptide (TPR) repeat protein
MMRTAFVFMLLVFGLHHSHKTLLRFVAPGGVAKPSAFLPADASNRGAVGPRPRVVPNVLPSSEALALLSLGYKNLAADYFWLRSIYDYGDKRMAREHYPNLWPLLSRAHALDPLFAAPYLFAGNAMTLNSMPWKIALGLLEEGMQLRPDLWRIPFVYGFNVFYLEQNYLRASRALAKAAENPEAPPFVAALAARLAAEAGEPEVGINMVDAILAETKDPAFTQILEDRRRRLLLEVYLKDLNRALTDWTAAHHGRAPRSLTDLVGPNGLKALPLDPLGGNFFLATDGTVGTQHEAERLRLSAEVKESNRVSH